MRTKEMKVPNGDGWILEARRSWIPGRLRPELRPVVMIPGFGNNASVFSYPDEERSFEGVLAAQGREVWSVNLRGQGGSRRKMRGSRILRVEDMALTDLGCLLDFIAEHSLTYQKTIDAIGASLGGSVLYVHTSIRTRHRLGAIVTIGSPCRWEGRHPVVEMALRRPDWVGWFPVRGSKLFLRTLFPLLRHYPIGLKAYIHPKTLASPSLSKLLESVDDPNRHLTRQLARWISQQDLILKGVNITRALRYSQTPLLCVVGNCDGIVPRAAALSAIEASGAPIKEVLKVGTRSNPFGHTDPFIHRDAPKEVFLPVARWLERQRGFA